MAGDQMSSFSPRAQQALALARKEADRFNQGSTGTSHLLLGLLKLEPSTAVSVLKQLGADPEVIRLAVEKHLVAGPDQKATGDAPFTPRLKKIIGLGVKEARKLNSTYVGTEHLLLGMLRGVDDVAGQVLRDFKVDIIQVRQEILKAAGLPPTTPAKGIFGRMRAFCKSAIAEAREARMPMPAMSNFTPRAQQALALARTESSRLNHNFLGTEHLLLGIIKLGQGVAVNVLQKRGLDLEAVRTEVEKLVGSGPDQKMTWNIPYTPRVKKVIALAQQEAKNLNHTYTGTEHLLLGLLGEGDGVAAKVLRNLDVDIKQIRLEILKELDPNLSGSSPVGEPADKQAIRPADAAGTFNMARAETAGLALCFTPHAIQVFKLARQEADLFHHNYIGTEHLLLGLIELGQGGAAKVLQDLGLSLEAARAEVEKWAEIEPFQKLEGNIPYTPGVIKVFAFAEEQAKKLNHTYVGTEHLLLGLLRDGDGQVAKIFTDFKVNAEQTYRNILKELDPKR